MLDTQPAELKRWDYQLTVIPARPAAIVTVAVFVLTYLSYVADTNPEVVAKIETYLKTARTESKEFPIRESKAPAKKK